MMHHTFAIKLLKTGFVAIDKRRKAHGFDPGSFTYYANLPIYNSKAEYDNIFHFKYGKDYKIPPVNYKF